MRSDSWIIIIFQIFFNKILIEVNELEEGLDFFIFINIDYFLAAAIFIRLIYILFFSIIYIKNLIFLTKISIFLV